MTFFQSYRVLFFISLAATAFSQHWFQHYYCAEMISATIQQGLEVVQKHAATLDDDQVHEFGPGSGAVDPESHTEKHSCPVCSHQVGQVPSEETGRAQTHAHLLATHTPDGCHVHHVQVHPASHPVHDHGGADPEHHDEHDAAAGHDHQHDHEHAHATQQDPVVSPGLVLMLRQLGFAELAANLLWIQMDADSHRGLWHRVEFALELIPTLDPTFIDAYLLRAFMLDEYQARHDEAAQILETAARNNPNRIELWQQLGLQYLNHTGRHGPKRNLPRALEALSKANRVIDPPPFLIRLIAVTLAAMERREEAIQILRDVMATPGRSETQRQQDATMMNRILAGEKF